MSDLRDSTGIVANDGMVGPDGGVGLDLSGWPLRLNIAADVAKGMAYLHGEGIFHRDLTSKNVLVRVSTDTTGGYTQFIALCSFFIRVCLLYHFTSQSLLTIYKRTNHDHDLSVLPILDRSATRTHTQSNGSGMS